MLINAELRRNLWLDFTPHRMLITPITIALILYLVYLSTNPVPSATTAFYIACFFIFFWGTKNASETVVEEVNRNTWDFQRQSTISPWAMTVGKLLGSTAFSWYGAFWALLFYALLHQVPPSAYALFTTQTIPVWQEILLLIGGGLFGQALALLFSMQLLPLIRRERSNKTFRYFLAGSFLGMMMTSYCFQAFHLPTFEIKWFQYHFLAPVFASVTLLLFLGWAILGLQRSFCKELQYLYIPWVWTVFNLFCMFYFAGLINIDQMGAFQTLPMFQLNDLQKVLSNAPAYTAFFIAQLLTYFAIFSDDLTVVRYKKFITRWHMAPLREGLALLPWWTISLFFTVGAGLVAVFQQSKLVSESISPAALIFTTLLFLIRDILLIHYFCFSKSPRKAMGAAVLYLFILYMLFPLLLEALHFSDLTNLFWPSYGKNTLLSVLSSSVQIALLGWLCVTQWKVTWQKTQFG